MGKKRTYRISWARGILSPPRLAVKNVVTSLFTLSLSDSGMRVVL